MSVESRFAKVSERLLGDGRGVERGRMLHSVGLKTAGKFFAFTAKGELIVKLPARRVDELVAKGVGRPCAPRPGRPMREWVRLRPSAEAACAAYVAEARDFVASRAGGLAPRRPGRPRGGSS